MRRCLAPGQLTEMPAAEGGRKQPPPAQFLSGGTYRPHLVVGDPNQRQAIRVGDWGTETYLGVAFLTSPEHIEVGKRFLAELVLMYAPHVVYDALVPGAMFTVREGPKIVAYGRVMRVLASDEA